MKLKSYNDIILEVKKIMYSYWVLTNYCQSTEEYSSCPIQLTQLGASVVISPKSYSQKENLYIRFCFFCVFFHIFSKCFLHLLSLPFRLPGMPGSLPVMPRSMVRPKEISPMRSQFDSSPTTFPLFPPYSTHGRSDLRVYRWRQHGAKLCGTIAGV